MSDQASYDPKKLYAVKFTRVVQMGSFKYLPRDTTLFQGGALNRIVEEHGADVIHSAEPR